MVSEQTKNNNNDNKKEAPTGNTIDPVQFGEEINKMLGIWSELSKLPTVGPNMHTLRSSDPMSKNLLI